MNLEEIKKGDKTYYKLAGLKYDFSGSFKEITKSVKDISILKKIKSPNYNSELIDLYNDISTTKYEIEIFLQKSNLPNTDSSMIQANKIYQELTEIENSL